MTLGLLRSIYHYAVSTLPWMSWNLFLGLAPWALAVWTFRAGQPIRRAQLLPAALTVIFLPNAAYVLTDIVHLPRHIRQHSDAVVLAGVLPIFAVFMAVGFAAYLDAVRRIVDWAQSRWSMRRWPFELSLHAVSTVGIYLGRVHRYNSWDIALHPLEVASTAVVGFTRSMALAGMLVTFVVLVTGQAMLRTFQHGIAAEFRSRHFSRHPGSSS